MSARDKSSGRYTHSLDRPCACGHTLGQHTADQRGAARPCLAPELVGEPCECECFVPRRAGEESFIPRRAREDDFVRRVTPAAALAIASLDSCARALDDDLGEVVDVVGCAIGAHLVTLALRIGAGEMDATALAELVRRMREAVELGAATAQREAGIVDHEGRNA